MTKLKTETTLSQGKTIVDALDFYSRLSMGQLEELAYLVSTGVIPVYNEDGKRQIASSEVCDEIRELMLRIKSLLGFRASGSYGLGNRGVCDAGHQAWEIKKVMEKALAEHHNPNPSFRTTQYDGLVCRYTSDPVPVATVEED